MCKLVGSWYRDRRYSLTYLKFLLNGIFTTHEYILVTSTINYDKNK